MKLLLLPAPLLVIIFTMTIAVPTTLGNDICKKGISQNVRQKSGDGKCYAFFKDEDERYNNAHSICQQYGGSLAMPKTQAINDLLSNEMTKLNLDDDAQYWIGLNDQDKENVFVWEDGTKFDGKQFESWNSEDEGPRDGRIQHSLEDCVGIDKFGKWHDFICKSYFFERKMPFVCEFNLPQTATTTATPSPTPAPTATPAPTPAPTAATPAPTQAPTAATPAPTPAPTAAPSPTQAPTAATPAPTPDSMNIKTTTGCPPLVCTRDCGLVGYKTIPATGCFLCECDD